MDDETFLKEFEACAIPASGWRHRDHLKVAYLYLRQYGLNGALEKVPAGIKALNAAQQTPETLDRGYHETITLAWLRIVHATLQEYGPAANADAFLEQQSQLLEKNLLRLFYSRERLKSWQAKSEFVEPDLAPLPISQKKTAL